MTAHQAAASTRHSGETATESPMPEGMVRAHGQRFWQEARLMVGLFTALTVGVLLLWFFWDEEYLSHDEDLVYNLGLTGGILLLFQFVYSMRKRIPALRRLGSLKVWFAIHTAVGIGGPLVIIIHSRFDISSINGGVAFFSMLLVVFSGMVGRYLYSKINFDFAGERARLKSLHEQLHVHVLTANPRAAQVLAQPLKAFMLHAFAAPGGFFAAMKQAVTIGMEGSVLHARLTGDRPATGAHVPPLLEQEKMVLRAYINAVARLARYNAFKHLFALWRVAHVPVIYFLLVAGLAHVLAVHMY